MTQATAGAGQWAQVKSGPRRSHASMRAPNKVISAGATTNAPTPDSRTLMKPA